jgi:cbb3-type cytochrome oxidase maturation protein
MMPSGMWMVAGWMLFVILMGLAFMAWGFENGQFDDVEEPKYRMMEDREPEGWPGRERGGDNA